MNKKAFKILAAFAAGIVAVKIFSGVSNERQVLRGIDAEVDDDVLGYYNVEKREGWWGR